MWIQKILVFAFLAVKVKKQTPSKQLFLAAPGPSTILFTQKKYFQNNQFNGPVGPRLRCKTEQSHISFCSTLHGARRSRTVGRGGAIHRLKLKFTAPNQTRTTPLLHGPLAGRIPCWSDGTFRTHLWPLQGTIRTPCTDIFCW